MAYKFREPVREEKEYVIANLVRLNLVEDEYIRCSCQQREAKAFLYALFRATGDEEFALGDLRHTNCPMTGRITEAGSSSLHSSKASLTNTTELLDSRRGWAINLCVWLNRDSWATSGSDRNIGTKMENRVCFWAS